MNLKGRAALVTGGSRGIGRSIAVELSKAGAFVAIGYSKDEVGAEETLKLIREYGGYGISIKSDVGDYAQAGNMVDQAASKFGGLDILVNNAGISYIGLFMDMKEDNWNKILDVDLKGVFNCSHHALRYMTQNERGSIINISSIWGNAGASCEAIYSAAKGAVNSFTKALAKEMAGANIRVNAIAPGVIETEMNSWLSHEEREELVQQIPLNSFGTGEDIGKLTVFLSSDAAKYITGQVITVDGGML